MLKALEKIAVLFSKHPKEGLLLAFGPASIGIFTDRFVGGAVAYYAGNFQFLALVIYFWLSITALLFFPYSSRIGTILQHWALVCLRVVAFLMFSTIAIFCIGVTLVNLHYSS